MARTVELAAVVYYVDDDHINIVLDRLLKGFTCSAFGISLFSPSSCDVQASSEKKYVSGSTRLQGKVSLSRS